MKEDTNEMFENKALFHNKIEIYKSPNRKTHIKKIKKVKFESDSDEEEEEEKIKKNKKNGFHTGRKRGNSQRIKRAKELIISDYDEINAEHILTNREMKTPNIKSSKSVYQNNILKKKFKKKKVTFKKKFVDIVNIESYKKYNLNKSLNNDSEDTKCSCIIY